MNTHPALGYIRANWSRSINRDAPGTGFGGVDLPCPYSSPCIKGEGNFTFFFYWDTYFTNLGLLRHGHAGTARDNIRNMLWLTARYGFMPNHVGITNRSQPPFLARMVHDYLAATGDEAFLAEAAPALRQEYHFWATARHTPTGLQRHGHHDTAEGAQSFYSTCVQRLGAPKDAPDAVKRAVGSHHLAEAETGWDFTPRFDGRCMDHNPADLNGLLHDYEVFLAEWSDRLGWGDAALWRERAAARRERVNRFLWSEQRGLFLDYDFTRDERSPVGALATFVPLLSGLATPDQAARVRGNLPLFEREFGVAATEDCARAAGYQWAFPNVWPPLVYITVEALRRYGFDDDARRIAGKFVGTTIRLFERTGQLWEKTDAVTGDVAGGEYDAAPMLGWSAGVFVALAEFLDRG